VFKAHDENADLHDGADIKGTMVDYYWAFWIMFFFSSECSF